MTGEGLGAALQPTGRSLSVDEYDYREANRAHIRGLNVSVEGRVERRGNYSYIRDASALEIVEGLDLDGK